MDISLKRLAIIIGIVFICAGQSLYAEPVSQEMPAYNKASQNLQKNLNQEKAGKDAKNESVDLILPANTEVDKTSALLPKVKLTNDLLYQILSADIADQKGFNQYAFDTMMSAAKETKDPRLARRAAEIAVKSRKSKEALEAVRFWYRLTPDSTEAERYLLGFLIMENKLDEVKSLFSAQLAKTQSGDRIGLFYQYQQVLAGSKNKAEAFSVMEEILKPYDNMADAHIALAAAAFLNNDSARAKNEALKALSLKPNSEMAILTFAQASSDSNEAIEVLSKFLGKYPDSREVRIAVARLMVAQKRYAIAKIEFEKLRVSQPQDLMVLYSLGLLSIQQNDYSTAEKYLIEYLNIASALKKELRESTQVLFLLTQIAEEKHHYDEALQWLSKIDQNDEDEVSLMTEIKKAQIYAKKGNIERTRRIIAELKNENPYQRERLLLTEAQIFRDIKKNKEAFNILQKGKAKFPESTNILYDYALTAESLGKYNEMEIALKRIIELDPHNQQAYNALGYSLADRNLRLDEASELIEKAIKLAPKDPFITDSFGWVLFRQGKINEAEQILRQAYALRSDPEIAVHLAEVLWVKGEKSEAIALLKEVKAKDHNNELFKSMIIRLKIKL